MKIFLALVSCCAVALTTAETLVEHEYGVNHDQLDDGFPYVPRAEVSEDDPSFAQGYFLRDAAEGPDNARCLDGTPPLYYHRKGTGSGANKWFIHQQGGGWCYNLDSCVSRSKGSLGSTKADKNTSSLNSGYTSMDPAQNPLMYNWNSVEIRYCDGASVSGDKPTPTVHANTTLHFRGRAILDAEIKSLLFDRGMKDATDIIVSGCSAGGLATFLHCDHWAAIGKANDATKVACMPDSGFFLDEDRAPQYGSNMRNVYSFQQSSAAGLNAKCVQSHSASGNDPEKCIFAEHTSEHISTPTFPLQSQYDSWQTGNVMGGGGDDATQNEFGRNLTARVQNTLLAQPQHGIFLDSCHHHCGAWNGPVIDSLNSSFALQAWYETGSAKLTNNGF